MVYSSEMKNTAVNVRLNYGIFTTLTSWRRIFFLQILAHPVFKM